VTPLLSVVLPTHNPHTGRLQRTLAALAAQTLPGERWEILLVDNASAPAIERTATDTAGPGNLRVCREPELGLNAARRRGFREAKGEFLVLVDDDNVLAPDYLERALAFFASHPRVGAIGGRSLPEFEREPAAWQGEFFPLLALRDPGDAPIISAGLRPAGAGQNQYPAQAAPIGAGMALRRAAAAAWLDASPAGQVSDRRGRELSSGGDNDIVLTLMKQGWEVAYVPDLRLTHLIPAGRLEPDYLARLNRGIQKSWMQVLSRHDANPWPRIAAWTVPLRQTKAWFTHHGWSGPAAWIRWQGACGHFEGRASGSR
jgi:glycosyltransferase involved in cell wall biosynthesis